ncbi:MAG: hypothetical protein ABH878_00985, partial [bacterium]
MNNQLFLSKAFLFLLFILFISSTAALAQMQYEEGVWVSYTDFHQVNDIAVGSDEIYIATNGGVLRYHRYRHSWEDPWGVVRGQVSSIDLRASLNVDHLGGNNVAVLTNHGAYQYDITAEYWSPTEHEFSSNDQTDLSNVIFIDSPGFTISGRKYFFHANNTIMDSDLRTFPLGVFADDGWGNWWIAVAGVGVLQLDTHMQRGVLWELGLFGVDVQAIAQGKGWTVLAG